MDLRLFALLDPPQCSGGRNCSKMQLPRNSTKYHAAIIDLRRQFVPFSINIEIHAPTRLRTCVFERVRQERSRHNWQVVLMVAIASLAELIDCRSHRICLTVVSSSSERTFDFASRGD